MPCSEISGTKYGQIEMEDVQGEIEFLENVVVCCVEAFFVMKGYLKSIWGKYDVEQIADLHDGLFWLDLDQLTREIQSVKVIFSLTKNH